jgi:serine protease inhibitor
VQIDIADALRNHGVTKVFDPRHSDLSGINGFGGLFVDVLRSRLHMEVDEKGTRATQLDLGGARAVAVQPMIRFQSPFAWMIFSKTAQEPVLIGAGFVADPTLSK